MSTNQKKWFTPIFHKDDLNEEPPQKRPRLYKSSSQNSLQSKGNGSQSASASIDIAPSKINSNNFSSANWIENFTPQSIADLTVNTKKIDEIKEWISKWELNRNSGCMLLITGPPGSGKTATIRLIAKELDYDLREWIVPVDIEIKRHAQQVDEQANTYIENQSDKFSQFLFRSSRYASIFNNNNKRLLMVEDFPNIFINNAEEFNDILGNYCLYGKSPLVFIAADTKNSKLDISYNLFGDAVLESYKISKICFNAVSANLLKKGLKRITSIMATSGFSSFYKQPSTELIESIIITSNGDIRNAVINLHFASQKNAEVLTLQPVPTTSKTKGNKINNKLKALGCDESITIMHALGRVLNPKYLDPPPSNGIKTLQHSPELLANDFLSQPMKFVNLLHTNYMCHFKDIESVVLAADVMSQSDVYLNNFMDDSMSEIGLTLAVRGVMISNEQPASGWIPIKGRHKVNENKATYIEQLNKFGLASLGISPNTWSSDYRTFVNIIKR